MQSIKMFIHSLWVLALISLAIEQIIHCLLLPGYFFTLLTSPLFWGIESILCFAGLWRFNQLHPADNNISDKPTEQLDEWFGFMEDDNSCYPLFDPDTDMPISAGK